MTIQRIWQQLNAPPTNMKTWAAWGFIFAAFYSSLPLIAFLGLGLVNPIWYGAIYIVSMLAYILTNWRIQNNIVGEIKLSHLKGSSLISVLVLSGAGALIGCMPKTSVYGAIGLTVALLATFWVTSLRCLRILGFIK